MKHKSVCVVDIKPKTTVLNFWLKNPSEMELDAHPKIEEREPYFDGIEARSDRDYIGMNYTKQLQLKYTILIIYSSPDRIITCYLCLLKGTCPGDSGGSYWKKEPETGSTDTISTVLAIVSSSPPGGLCSGVSIGHKIAHKDILKWISKNWVK